jgi:hypothetical protein
MRKFAQKFAQRSTVVGDPCLHFTRYSAVVAYPFLPGLGAFENGRLEILPSFERLVERDDLIIAFSRESRQIRIRGRSAHAWSVHKLLPNGLKSWRLVREYDSRVSFESMLDILGFPGCSGLLGQAPLDL